MNLLKLINWENFNKREQIGLIIAVFMMIIYLLNIFIYEPLSNKLLDHELQLKNKIANLQWLQKQISAHKINHKKKINNQQLLNLLSQELDSIKFKSFDYNIQQINHKNNIKLSFRQVPYNLIIKWLWDLEYNYTVLIKKLIIERTKISGVIKFEIIFEFVP